MLVLLISLSHFRMYDYFKCLSKLQVTPLVYPSMKFKIFVIVKIMMIARILFLNYGERPEVPFDQFSW